MQDIILASFERAKKTLKTEDGFSGVLLIQGHYKIGGTNDKALDQNFSADLDIHQAVCLVLPIHDDQIYINMPAYDELYEILNSALTKAKAFQNPGCADSLHFDPNGMIRLIYSCSWDSMEESHIEEYPVRSMRDLEKLLSNQASPKNDDSYTNQSFLYLSSPMMFCFNAARDFFNSPSYEKTTSLRVSGQYKIIAAGGRTSVYNSGFKAKLMLEHKINSELTHNSSKDKDHLNNILSTVLFKVNSFRNKKFSDPIQFSGKVTIVPDDNDSAVKTFIINDLYHLQMFVDYMSHLSLPSLVVSAALPQTDDIKQNSNLNQSLLDRKQQRSNFDRTETEVRTCYQSLRNLCS